jgi:hypothetical protein
MMGWLGIIALLLAVLFQGKESHAALFSLPELEQPMLDPIFRTLGNAFVFRPIEPASDLGLLGGFYIGASASFVDATAVSSIFTSSPISFISTGDIQLGLGIPLSGITFEAGVLPSISLSGTQFRKYSGAVKWTLTRTILKVLPFSAALRVSYSTGNLSYTQDLSAGSLSVDYNANSFGTNFVFSKALFIFEPYAGIGWVNSSSKLAASGTANLFGTSFPLGTTSIERSYSSLWTQFGLLMKLGVFGISFGYDKMLSASSWNGKVSLRF